MARGKPYRPASSKKGETAKWLHQRHKWFSLTPEQYQELGSTLFTYMQELTDMKVSKWKSSTYNIKTTYSHWRRSRGKGLSYREVRIEVVRGVRFSIGAKDDHLLADIYAAQLRNPAIQSRMRGMARYIDLRLSPHRLGFRRKFSKLQAAEHIKDALQSSTLPSYLKVEVVKSLPPKTLRQFQGHLFELLEWDGVARRQTQLANAVLPQHRERVNGTQLRVIREKHDYVVLEMLAQNAHHLSSEAHV
jgi:hypothetical protein